MMKEEISIFEYNSGDAYIDNLVLMHQKIFNDSSLKDKLIYFDKNFKSFFSNLVKSPDNKIYTIFIKKTIVGFLHLRCFDDTLFLNNIFISNDFQGKSLGKILLYESIKKNTGFKYFSLDVFMSNVKALNWYKKLSLDIIDSSKWYALAKYPNAYNTNIYKTNVNGFNGIYIGDTKVGTVINENSLIINEIRYIDKIKFNDFSTVITNQDITTVSIDYRFQEIEQSVRMKGKLTKVLEMMKL